MSYIVIVIIIGLVVLLGMLMVTSRNRQRVNDLGPEPVDNTRRELMARKVSTEEAKPELPAPTELVVGDPQFPDIRITRASLGTLGKLEPLSLPTSMQTSLGLLLQHAPRALVAGAQAAQAGTWLLEFSPQTVAMLHDGSATLVPALQGGVRAIARSTDGGSFIEHGSLVSGVNAFAVAGAVWQVLAIVTAQKFLLDINKRLAAIEQGVSAIRNWLENDKMAAIEGNFATLRDTAKALSQCQLSDANYRTFQQQAAEIDRESRKHMIFYAKQVEDVRNRVLVMPFTGIGVIEHAAQAQQALCDYGRYAQAYMVAANVRATAGILRAAVGLSAEHALASMDELGAETKSKAESFSTFVGDMAARIPTLVGEWSFVSTDEGLQRDVREALDKHVAPLASHAEALGGNVAKAVETARSLQNPKPLRVVVQTGQDGSIQKVGQLTEPDSPRNDRAEDKKGHLWTL